MPLTTPPIGTSPAGSPVHSDTQAPVRTPDEQPQVAAGTSSNANVQPTGKDATDAMRALLRQRGNDPFGGGPEELESPPSSPQAATPQTPVSVEAGLSPSATLRPRRKGNQGTAGFLEGVKGFGRSLSNLGSKELKDAVAPQAEPGSPTPAGTPGSRTTKFDRRETFQGVNAMLAARAAPETPTGEIKQAPPSDMATPTSRSGAPKKQSVIGVPQAAQLSDKQRIEQGKAEAVRLITSQAFREIDDKSPTVATKEKLRALLSNGPAAYALRRHSEITYNRENLAYLNGARTFLAMKDDPVAGIAALKANHQSQSEEVRLLAIVQTTNLEPHSRTVADQLSTFLREDDEDALEMMFNGLMDSMQALASEAETLVMQHTLQSFLKTLQFPPPPKAGT